MLIKEENISFLTKKPMAAFIQLLNCCGRLTQLEMITTAGKLD
jgi:hypothetical protein